MVKPKKVKTISHILDRLLTPLIKPLAKQGVTANYITFLQLPFILLFILFLAKGIIFYGIISLGITLFLDTLDGIWARVTNNITKKGHKYDKIFDLIGIYAFLFAISINCQLAFSSRISAA